MNLGDVAALLIMVTDERWIGEGHAQTLVEKRRGERVAVPRPVGAVPKRAVRAVLAWVSAAVRPALGRNADLLTSDASELR